MCLKANYGYVQSKAATRETIGCIRDAGGNPTLISLEKASALQHHFEALCTVDPGNTVQAQSTTTERPMDKILIGPQKVEKTIEALDRNKPAGPDDMHRAILKPLKGILARPLASLVIKSVETATFPSDFKAAIVTHIYKGATEMPP
ncbi:unnamed protein product [Echinostoma caproni]|uniref:Reverse transcriptase domain-containing protein n=1 Tax=Echinostoma caproni TaxID=27848 RepID=A0A183ARY3_9TREM|nr:unnamed protein product [Echinostoma caproni]